MNEILKEIREFVRSEIIWTAEFLRKNYGLSPKKIKRVLREMLDVTI